MVPSNIVSFTFVVTESNSSPFVGTIDGITTPGLCLINPTLGDSFFSFEKDDSFFAINLSFNLVWVLVVPTHSLPLKNVQEPKS